MDGLVLVLPREGSVECSSRVEIKWVSDEQGIFTLHYATAENPDDWILIGTTDSTSYTWDVSGLVWTSAVKVKVAKDGDEQESGYFFIDTSNPTISWLTPSNGDILSGVVLLQAMPYDDVGVVRVEFYYSLGTSEEWLLAGYSDNEPWRALWDTTCIAPDGIYTLKAIAYDRCGNASAPEFITVALENLPDHYVQVLVDGVLTIPPQKPNIEQIVEFKVYPIVTDIKSFPAFGGRKLLIIGQVAIEVIYVAAVPDQTVHTAHFSTPIKTYLQWQDLDPCAVLEPITICEHIKYDICGPRSISEDIVVFIGIKDRVL